MRFYVPNMEEVKNADGTIKEKKEMKELKEKEEGEED
jgi:hypothetical protein